MGKTRTINIEPHHLETKARYGEGEFTLEFHSENKIVKVRLNDYWIRAIASDLNGVIAKRQVEVDDARRAMRGEEISARRRSL